MSIRIKIEMCYNLAVIFKDMEIYNEKIFYHIANFFHVHKL